MKTHPILAFEMLQTIEYLHPALDIPHHHHERWDGSGYPDGLKGTDIPLAARIFAIVDVFNALTSDRPYRKALPVKEAVDYISANKGVLFDPNCVDEFIDFLRAGGETL